MGWVNLFLNDENGQGFVEYGLVIFLVAIAVVGCLTVLGPKVAEIFNDITLHEAFEFGSP